MLRQLVLLLLAAGASAYVGMPAPPRSALTLAPRQAPRGVDDVAVAEARPLAPACRCARGAAAQVSWEARLVKVGAAVGAAVAAPRPAPSRSWPERARHGLPRALR